MNYFLIQAIPIANIGDQESSFWMQILVFVLAVVFFGVYSLTKNNRSKHKDQQQKFPHQTAAHYAKSRWRFPLLHKPVARRKGIVQEYIAKMKDVRHHITNLSQGPKLGFDSLGKAGQKNLKNKPAARKNKDLQSGMELLELDFLLSIVENTKGNDQKDVTIRKLNFNELIRREKLSHVSSKALTVYATNRANLYGKNIQCKAMGQLAERTTPTNSHEIPISAVSPKKAAEKIVDVK